MIFFSDWDFMLWLEVGIELMFDFFVISLELFIVGGEVVWWKVMSLSESLLLSGE